MLIAISNGDGGLIHHRMPDRMDSVSGMPAIRGKDTLYLLLPLL